MQEECEGYRVVTAEMHMLAEYVKRAKGWIEKADGVRN